MLPASRKKRFLAYVIDIIPIVALVVFIAWTFFGAGEIWSAYKANKGSSQALQDYYEMKSLIRDLSFLVWVVYAMILEASVLQGTVGKFIVGIRVVDSEGNRLTFKRSAARNIAKILSYLPVGLGFIWSLFNREKKCWHDMLSKSAVVVRQ